MHKLGLGLRNVAEGVGGLGGLLYDAAAIPQNALNAGVKAATGYDLGLSTRANGAERIAQGLDAVGLPRPRTHGEVMAGRMIEGMAGAIPTMGAGAALQAAGKGPRLAAMLVDKPVTQLASGAGSGAATQVAEDNGAGPVGSLAAGLVGGLGGAAVPEAAKLAGRSAQALAMPFTEAGRGRIAADMLLQQSSDPATLAARLRAGTADEGRRLENSPVTTATAARDAGLAQFESGLANISDPAAVAGPLPRARLEEVATRRNAARADEMPEVMPGAVGIVGAQLRDDLAQAERGARARVGEAYQAVDPDGTARLPAEGIRRGLDDLSNRYYGELSGGLPEPIRRVRDELDAFGGSVPWQAAQNLRSRVDALLRDASTLGDARAQAVLRGLKQSVDDAAEGATRPQEPYSRPATREGLVREDVAEGVAERPDVAHVLRVGRNEVSPRTNEPPQARPESLASFLVRQGGLRDDAGEVLQTLGGTVRTRPGLLNNRGGLSLDEARARAQQAGYIGKVGQDTQGAFGTTIDELLQALDADLNRRGGTRPIPLGETSFARSEEAALRADVDRDLASRGLSLSDPPETLFPALREAEPVPAGGPAPDGYAPLPGGLTPEQATAWKRAQKLRATMAADFRRDGTGTAATGSVLAKQEGQYRLADQNVLDRALATPDAARQVMRAGGEAAAGALRTGFMDRMASAVAGQGRTAADGRPMLSTPAFEKFWRANEAVARAIFPPDRLAQMERLAADFSETASMQQLARARGSDTARNLSVANALSLVSRGLLDPSNPLAQSVLRPFGWATKVPERAIRDLLGQAAADPEVALRLLDKATPENIQRAADLSSKSGAARAGEAAQAAGVRLGLRAATTATPRPTEAQQRALSDEDIEQNRRREMARMLKG